MGALAKLLRDRLAGVNEDELIVVVASRTGTIARTIQVGGRMPDLRDLELGVEGARLALHEVAEGPTVTVQLTAEEAKLLERGGFSSAPAGRATASDKARVAYVALLHDALSPERAATRLGVNASRVRQRLGERTLYGIKDGRSWKVPVFQFVGKRLVPGIERVLPRIPKTVHPVAVVRWFSTPSTELVDENDEPRSPLTWLLEGGSPEPVAELAAEL